MMIGKEVGTSAELVKIEYENKKGKLLELKNLSKKGNFKDINLNLYEGEVLGITGLLGSGRTELALALFGISAYVSGDIYINGSAVKIRSNQDALRNGVTLVPEDRLKNGLIFDQTIGSNLIISIIDNLLSKLKLIIGSKKNDVVYKLVKKFEIKCSSPDMLVQSLSGGNQQRVVLAKCLATSPKILILDSPTAGIDIGAKFKIYNIIKDLSKEGMGIILISDEAPELIRNCNRVLIMKRGRIIKELTSAEITEENIKKNLN